MKHSWLTTGQPVGRRPALDEGKLAYLEKRLEEKPYWTTKEVADLIVQQWEIRLSLSQVARILKEKLNMHFGKPYPHDYRRPADAEEAFRESLMAAYNRLFEKGLKAEEIALGFLDESSPQLTANTAKVWHFGKATITKNTARMKANVIVSTWGGKPLVGSFRPPGLAWGDDEYRHGAHSVFRLQVHLRGCPRIEAVAGG